MTEGELIVLTEPKTMKKIPRIFFKTIFIIILKGFTIVNIFKY